MLIQPPPSHLTLLPSSPHPVPHITAPFLSFPSISIRPNTLSRTSLIYDLCVCLFDREHPAETVYVTGTFDNWSGSTHKLDKEGSVHSKTVELEPTTDKILYKVRIIVIFFCSSLHCPSHVCLQCAGNNSQTYPNLMRFAIQRRRRSQHKSSLNADAFSSSSPTVSGNTIPLTTQKLTELAT
jgi:hypothetical protein